MVRVLCKFHSVIILYNNFSTKFFLSIQLYSDLLPLTCQHFLNLCNGYDEVRQCYRDAYYINTRVHRIVKNGWIQCGGKIKYI